MLTLTQFLLCAIVFLVLTIVGMIFTLVNHRREAGKDTNELTPLQTTLAIAEFVLTLFTFLGGLFGYISIWWFAAYAGFNHALRALILSIGLYFHHRDVWG